MMKKKTAFILFIALLLVVGITQTAFAEENWNALFEQEWRAMGLEAAPEILPAPEGAPFPYSLITPGTVSIPNEEAVVVMLMGDGFTDSPEDQAKWRYYCQFFANGFLEFAPINEFKDRIKIYRIDAISEDNGVTADSSPDGRHLPGIDPRNTYFGGRLWDTNTARAGAATTPAGHLSARDMTTAYIGYYQNVSMNVFFNTDTYGGRGGNPAYTALSWGFLDVAVHELGHSVVGLSEEYIYSGPSQLNSARNAPFGYSAHSVHRDWINNPTWRELSPWYRLLGKNGTTFNPWLEGLTTDPDFANFFRPHPGCKMRFVGDSDILRDYDVEEFPFCEVCKEIIRDRFCRLSQVPVLHFQPYNDQFYDSTPVLLNDKHFIIRIPEIMPNTNNKLGDKVYGEDIISGTTVKDVKGTVKMTVSDDNGPIAKYTNVNVDTPLDLPVGTYTVEATFTGTYNDKPYELTLSSLENTFEVKPATIIEAIGKYAEPWNSTDKTDTLTREWRKNTPVTLPDLTIDPTRVHKEAVTGHFDITYSWHVRNFDGRAGQQLGNTGTYGEAPVDGPTSSGQYVLAIHTKGKVGTPAADYQVTNEYPFEITTSWHSANHYTVNAGVYSHESVANDFRGITIVGEGFTEADQEKFEALANDFITKFLDTDPVKRVASRFCFFIQNTMSADSGLSKEGGAQKDTYYGFQLKEDGSLGTYRTDMPMDLIIYREAWRRDTNNKTWAQWGATVVLINEEDTQANYHWRHPEANRSVHLATVEDDGYQRLIESLVAQFANVRSQRELDLLDTYRWMEGPGLSPNVSFEETLDRLVESCYSHEMYGSGILNLPRPVIYSDAATKIYLTNGIVVVDEEGKRVEDSFKAYSYGHELITNTVAEDTFTYRYYTDDGHRVGELLPGAPVTPGFYWVEADYPNAPKFYKGIHINGTDTDRYGFTYQEGDSLPGRNGQGTANSARTRGFVRYEIQSLANLQLKTDAHMIKKGDYFEVIPYFREVAASNAATLDFTFDKAKFQYRAFTPAEGVQMLQWVDTENGVRITVMSSGYNVTEYGKVMFSARDDIDLESEDNEIILSANYVVKLEDGTKEVKNEVASTIFTTYGDDPGDMDLILLSNLIDKFGLKKGDPEWNDFRFYDYNNNGEIDIYDITQVAVKINK